MHRPCLSFPINPTLSGPVCLPQILLILVSNSDSPSHLIFLRCGSSIFTIALARHSTVSRSTITHLFTCLKKPFFLGDVSFPGYSAVDLILLLSSLEQDCLNGVTLSCQRDKDSLERGKGDRLVKVQV